MEGAGSTRRRTPLVGAQGAESKPGHPGPREGTGTVVSGQTLPWGRSHHSYYVRLDPLWPWVVVQLKVMMLRARTLHFPHGHFRNTWYCVPSSATWISKLRPDNHKYDILSNRDIKIRSQMIITALTFIRCFLRGQY